MSPKYHDHRSQCSVLLFRLQWSPQNYSWSGMCTHSAVRQIMRQFTRQKIAKQKSIREFSWFSTCQDHYQNGIDQPVENETRQCGMK